MSLSAKVLDFFTKNHVKEDDVKVESQNLILTSVYDVASQRYELPQIAYNNASAQRSFLSGLSGMPKQNRIIAKDLRLFKLGYFDQVTGKIDALPVPVQIENGCNVKFDD